MLDDVKNDNGYAKSDEFEWGALSSVERRLVRLYRQLCEQDRKQLRRVTETLATNPEEKIAIL